MDSFAIKILVSLDEQVGSKDESNVNKLLPTLTYVPSPKLTPGVCITTAILLILEYSNLNPMGHCMKGGFQAMGGGVADSAPQLQESP